MISQPGDKRIALIAALIAVPAAAVITMAVHTFVAPGQGASVLNVYQTGVAAPAKSFDRGAEKKHGGFRKGDFKKRFMEFRKARRAMQQQVADLLKQRIALLEKTPGICPKQLVSLKCEHQLAQAAMLKHAGRLLMHGEPLSFTAVKAVTAGKIAALDKAGVKAGKVKPDTALQSEIGYLKLQLALTGNRIFHNPEWKKAYESYQQTPSLENIQLMLEAEREFSKVPRRRR